MININEKIYIYIALSAIFLGIAYNGKNNAVPDYFHFTSGLQGISDIKTMGIDIFNNVYVDSDSHGLYEKLKGRTSFEKLTYIPTSKCYFISNDANGNLWMGMDSGLYEKPKESNTFTQFINGLPTGQACISFTVNTVNNTIYVICNNDLYYKTKDSADFVQFSSQSFTKDHVILIGNNLWISGNFAGGNIYTNDNTSLFRIWTIVNSKIINNISTDARGNLWVSTDKGLLEKLSNQDSLIEIPYFTNIYINDVCRASNNVYVASTSGLYLENTASSTFTKVNEDFT